MKKILIVGQFTDNRGDQAACLGYYNEIIRNNKDIKICCLYFQTDNYLVENNQFMESYNLNPKRGGYCFIGLLFLFYLFRIKMNKYIKVIDKMIENSDIVVLSPGGPYIGEIYPYRDELLRLMFLLIAKLKNKKTMIYGPSMGPFNNICKNFFRKYVLDKVDIITVRDKLSFDYLKKLKLKNENKYLTCDSAIQRKFNYSKKEIDILYKKNLISLEKRIVGITPINLNWHPKWSAYKNIKEKNKYILNELAQTLDNIIVNYNVNVVAFPQLFGKQSDLDIINELIIMCENKKNIFVVDSKFNSDQQQLMISRLDAFIGMRYHSIIFSFIMKIPFIAISYEHKMEAFVREIEMEEYLLRIENFKKTKLLNVFDKVMVNKKDIIKKINSMYFKMSELSYQNTVFLKSLL